jgi:RHS repeat-associated protein
METESASEQRRFTGQEHDPESGLDYFGARYYAQRNGRFTTVDPVMNVEEALTNPQRWNRYANSLNNPLRYVDPDGAEIATPSVFFTKAFGQQTADNLRALKKVVVNIGRSINSPGHLTPEAEVRYFEQPDSATEASRMQFLDVMLTAAPALFGLRGQAGALKSVGSIDDVLSAPAALRGGITPEQLMQRVGTLPETWRVEALGKGSKEGAGWMLREYTRQGHPTGRQIRWHPGGGHHGGEPYWRVISYNNRSDIIR